MTDVLGIDIGFSSSAPTTGLCRSGDHRFLVGYTYADNDSRRQMVAPVKNYEVIAIDGPVLPGGEYDDDPRPFEKLLIWGAFNHDDLVAMREGLPTAGLALQVMAETSDGVRALNEEIKEVWA